MTSDRDRRFESVDLSRRRFLQVSAVGAGVIGVGGLLAACSGGSTTASSQNGANGKPVRGGTLRIGASGGGSTDTLDPQNWATSPDGLRVKQLFDPLVKIDNTGKPMLMLAESITPNSDGTEWTVKIIKGVTTHSGQPFTADDVLFSLRRIVDNKFPGANGLGPIDLKSSKVVDPTTLLLKYSKPFGALIEGLSLDLNFMVPRGFDLKKPDGTGPFMFKSYTPGVESTFVRNPNYWQAGKPYLDKIITTDVKDETAQVNGLQSGQFDVISSLSASSIATLRGSGVVAVVNKSGSWIPFVQNCSVQPFSDVRVRQAMRLIVDRPQMNEQVFAGYGAIGNDVFSPNDPSFPTDLPQRVQDIPKAKSLLKAAGYSDLSLKLFTCAGTGGMIESAEVLATQAKAAGVKVALEQQSVGDYFGKSYQKVAFGMDYGTTSLYLPNAGFLMNGKKSFYNANHFDDAEYNAAYANAVATPDASKRTQYIQDMARIDYERGAYIVPVFSPVVDGYSTKVGGYEKSITGVSPGNADFQNFWIS